MQEFLPDAEIKGLAEEAASLRESGKFRQAGVGQGSGFQVRSEIRGDQILWLDEERLTPLQQKYWDEIESLRLELNRNLFTGLTAFEAHFAIYPTGAFYQRHLDRFVASDERAISCTLYLNPNWREEDAGALRIYTDENGLEAFTDVLPQAGAFVVFRSDAIFHEVLPAMRERLSLTGWLKRNPSGFPHLMR